MLENMPFTKIYVITGYTDMRNGIAGLTALVRLRYGLDTLEEGTLFLFCGRSCKKFKGLFWDASGYCLVSKTLTKGAFQWPRNADEARTISRTEFQMLMSGFSIESRIPGSRMSA